MLRLKLSHQVEAERVTPTAAHGQPMRVMQGLDP